MSEIRVLPDEISNRIAAGEVVERPASVVKELVENAIDAGATDIQIEIRRAGNRLIAVTDDGRGMDAEDAVLCLEPHGTSKIREVSDIERILTMGFRGEAIPSIASVSRFILKTRRREDPSGVEITVDGGRRGEVKPYGGRPGTRIEVGELFCNVPARRKFLRSAATEESHIQETVIMLALPFPEIAFELSFDGKPCFRSPAGRDLRGRLREFFGRGTAERYLEVAGEFDGVRVSGYIAPPDWTRTTRREQRTFVNRRMVDSQAVYRGIRDGYGERAEAGRFPPVVLFVELDPGEFDINVHPTKKEVRFRNENSVAAAVARAIQATLRATPGPTVRRYTEMPVDALLDGAHISYQVPTAEQPEFPLSRLSDKPQPGGPPPAPLPLPHPSEPLGDDEPPPVYDRELPPEAFPTLPPEPAAAVPPPRPDANFWDESATEFLGIFAGCYILAGKDGELWIIDQHAAHERILYEKLLDGRREAPAVQQLLLPVTLELDRRAIRFLERNRAGFAELGFDLEELSSQSVMLSGVPADLPTDRDLERLLTDIFDALLAENNAGSLALPLETIARAACHQAVKAHDLLTPEEGRALLSDLGRCRRPDCCPHGRPTAIRIGEAELQRRFKRI